MWILKESFNIILIDWRYDFKYKYIIIKIVGGKNIYNRIKFIFFINYR